MVLRHAVVYCGRCTFIVVHCFPGALAQLSKACLVAAIIQLPIFESLQIHSTTAILPTYIIDTAQPASMLTRDPVHTATAVAQLFNIHACHCQLPPLPLLPASLHTMHNQSSL